jgi:hypothetical protein
LPSPISTFSLSIIRTALSFSLVFPLYSPVHNPFLFLAGS